MTLLLPEVPRWEWRASSQAQKKDQFGNENQTRFSLTARLADGHIAWRGWFDDRDDSDAFLWALARATLLYERELWDLPTPSWRPGIGEQVWYQFLTTTFIVSTSASNQTDSVPSDWNSGNNNIDVIASGASGGVGVATGGSASAASSGGGGGAWSRQTNVTLTPSGTATFFLNVGGAAVSQSGSTGTVAGNVGPDSWYNGTTLAGSSVGAKGGVGGAGNILGSLITGSAGGAAASGVGASKNSGGASGNSQVLATGSAASGGGGAGGLNAAGTASAAASTTVTAGGQGDGTSGGAGGAGGTSANGTAGSIGTEYDASHGSGGGGGGAKTAQGFSGGTGGNYGAGGGGGSGTATSPATTSGAGKQGMIVKQYTPASALLDSMMPMMGVG